MKTFAALALALLFWIAPVSNSSAVVVSWGFSGVLTELANNSNAIPANITVGMPFSGFVTYDTALFNGGDGTPGPTSSSFYFNTNAGISIVVQIGGVTLSTTNRYPGNVFAGIGVNDNLVNRYDELWLDVSGGSPLVNGAVIPIAFSNGDISINLYDYKKTAVSSDAVPTFVPNFPQFDIGSLSIYVSSQGAEAGILTMIGEITAFSTLPKVILTSTPLPGNQLRLSWPVSATGLTLQYTASLTNPDWKTEPTAVVDIATEHTATVSTVGQPKFFRLVKLP